MRVSPCAKTGWTKSQHKMLKKRQPRSKDAIMVNTATEKNLGSMSFIAPPFTFGLSDNGDIITTIPTNFQKNIPAKSQPGTKVLKMDIYCIEMFSIITVP
jgi:hypothetical protein